MNVKSFRAVGEHPSSRPLPWPKLDLTQNPLRIARQLAKTATMALRMNLSGKNFNARDPNFLQFCAATGGQFAAIDSRSADSLREKAGFVITRREPFSRALIKTEPQIFFHVVWQRAAYMPNEALR